MTFVDGVKYFDRSADPDDMRLEINVTTNPTDEFAGQEASIHN
jgi:hypothetical protein